jgi:apoptosis-inducing factor 2
MSRTVVVVGGGYGGAAVAKALESKADVVLIDPRDAFVNAAGSLRALAQPDWAGNMFFPFDTLLTRGTVIRDRAISVDPGGVTLASGRRVEADYLVLATGSNYAYPAKPKADSTREATGRRWSSADAAGREFLVDQLLSVVWPDATDGPSR